MVAMLKGIGSIFKGVFGRLSWQAPPWLVGINGFRRKQAGRFWGGLLTLMFITVAVTGAYLYYENLPKPLRYNAEALSPGVSPIVEGEISPQSLQIRFSPLLDSPELQIRYAEGVPGVARLELVGEELPTGVNMEPALPGTWQWANENTLHFEPAADWPAGQTYHLDFSSEILASHVRLDKKAVAFQTPQFQISIKEFRFYQDPVDKSIRKTVASIDFTHPVDEQSFEKHLELAMRPSGTGIKVRPEPRGRSVTYDEHHREAYIHSDHVTIGEQEQSMQLRISKGVATTLGGADSTQEVQSKVLIPSAATYFKVTTARSEIVRNDEDEPVQAVILQFSDFVKGDSVVETTQAWLLPKKNRGRQRWRGPREVTDAVLARAEAIDLDALPIENDAARLHSFIMDLPEGRDLYIRLERGLRSEGGYVMATPYDAVLRVPVYPKELRVMAEGALIAKSGDQRLPLLTRGLETLRYEVGRLIPGDVNHLVSQTHGDITNPDFSNYRFSEDNITERFEGFIDLNAGHPREANYASLELSRYLDGRENRLGLFFVRIQGWDRKHNRAISGAEDRRLVLVTDLGLLVKDNVDSSHEVFVQSVSSGEPVAGGRVELLGKNGMPILSGVTDERGHVHLAETRDFNREREPTVYVVRTGSDVSFIPFNRGPRFLNYSRFDVGGLQSRYQRDDQLTGYLFSDRGIYRPGEEGHLGAIVRRLDFSSAGTIPVEARITDPQGQTLLKQKMTLDATGFTEIDFKTDAAARTGTYQAAMYLIEANNRRRQLGATSFRVEEFQPDRLKIRTRFSLPPAKGWINSTELHGLVSLENLFGVPAQDRRIEADLTLNPTGFRFKDYPEYRFIDPYLDPKKPLRSVSERLVAQRSDDQGQARFELPLEKYQQGTYRLIFSAEGYEAGEGRSVSATTSLLLSPAKKLIGYKPDGDLNYLKRGAERIVEFVAVDPALKSVAYEGLKLRLVERQYVSTLVQQRDGTYRYQSVPKRKQQLELDFTISANGIRYQIPTGQAGDFEVELVDAQERVVSRLPFTVVGTRNLAGDLEKNAELTIKLDKPDYRTGEEIELSITAPYHGAGLITIERDRVYTFKWFKTDTTSSVQRITVPKGLEGNAYVNVAFIRAADSNEIFVNPLSYGVAPFTIDRARRKLALTLKTPERVKPGETLKIAYASSAPARMVVFAVDEGILQVADYQTPAPLDHFLQKRALEVRTAQIVDLILPEFALVQALAAGGGEADEAKALLGRNLNPFARQLEKSIAFWSRIVDADAQLREQDFDIPDHFNGQLRIMAVAVGAEGMGIARSSSLVRGPFVLSPNAPTAVAPGDEFDVTVGVANALERSGEDVKIELELLPSDNLQVIGEPKKVLAVSEGDETRAEFRVKALDALGASSMLIRARHGEDTARITATLSVRPAVPYTTSFQAGFEKDGRVTLEVPRVLYSRLASNRVTASVRPLALAEGLVAYLDHFPHYCTEQIVSQVYPLLSYLDHPDYQGDTRAKHQRLAALINSLRSRQTANGGFNLWPGYGQPAEFPSVYVAHFLTDARAQGVAVPRDMLDRVLAYLREYAGREPGSLADARLNARTLYVLTRNGLVTTNLLVRLQEVLEQHHAKAWRGDITAAYMAATYALLRKQTDARKLIAGYRLGKKVVVDWTDFDSQLAHDAQYVYLVSKHFDDRFNALQGEQILKLVQPIFEGRYNTVSSSAAILALGAYSQRAAAEVGVEQVDITEIDAEGNKQVLTVKTEPYPLAEVSVLAQQIAIAGPERLFTMLSQAGYDRALPREIVSNKLEIVREYLDADGNAITKASQGDELTVRLRIRALQGTISNVAVVDLLPGGFEVLRDSVRRDFTTWRADYTDVREDRVVFYGSFGTGLTELTYKVKLTARGSFVVPPPFAEAMYDRTAMARGPSGSFEVEAAQ